MYRKGRQSALRTAVLLARLRRLQHEEQGSGLLEFALSAVVLLTVIFGILDCSRALYADHYVAEAAREATRYAIVRGADWGSSCAPPTTISSCNAGTGSTGTANMTSYVRGLMPAGIDPANVIVTATWPGTTANGSVCTTTGTNNAQGCVVTATVSYNFHFVLPFLPANMLNLNSTSSATVLQ